ncbi:4Fe-4S dicluster domain-containing protein [Salisediminibacterium halotolerans]|uniref:Tat (Twin-arginine translocation) pathway signal sequence n=1 Tax=Salisediminibacterium halotolerans TaxID=517425 RepID=A0A1H9T9J2_9BACI|nr:4Fe-4S dicluster domain-containing protein [Salisediminibacterium haloalkalitolerans]SER93925.1 Tat (twin-arginine translocation) pathway signal sequence [Salisediminibacterium haloalkalitolerans]
MGEEVSRRSFLKRSAAACSGVSLLSMGVYHYGTSNSVSSSASAAEEGESAGVRYGMVIDNIECVACGMCQDACRDRHNLPEDENFIKLYEDFETGQEPNTKVEHFTAQCNHCENAPCARICPTQATYLNEDGIMVMDATKCIGCKGCIAACPYNARIWSEKAGIPEKCNFCDGFVQQGDEPACVQACPVNARTFGDLNDEDSEVAQKVSERNLSALRTELGTRPKIYYVRQS